MALTGVPWFVGGGAEHSPEVARLLAYAAMGGGSGVIAPTDFLVEPLPVPGKSIRMRPGAASIESLAASARAQTYLAHGATATDLELSDTPSNGGRSDLVYISIEDPFQAGETWDVPSDVANGPYVHLRKIEGVPAGTRKLQDVPGYSTRTGYAVARVDRGASTGTITSANVVDLRALARPRTKTLQMQASNVIAPGPGEREALKSTVWIRWPDVARWYVDVPSWATHVILRASVESFTVKTGLTTGRLAARIVSGNEQQIGPHVSFDENGSSNTYRSSLGMGAEIPIPASWRGKQAYVDVVGLRSQDAGFIDADSFTTALMGVTFEERVGS